MTRQFFPLNTGDHCRRCMGKGFVLGDDMPYCRDCDGTGDRARISWDRPIEIGNKNDAGRDEGQRK